MNDTKTEGLDREGGGDTNLKIPGVIIWGHGRRGHGPARGAILWRREGRDSNHILHEESEKGR